MILNELKPQIAIKDFDETLINLRRNFGLYYKNLREIAEKVLVNKYNKFLSFLG